MSCTGTDTKVHVTQTCDPPDPTPDSGGGDRPNIIVGVATTDAAVPDTKMTEKIHATLAARDLLCAEHYRGQCLAALLPALCRPTRCADLPLTAQLRSGRPGHMLYNFIRLRGVGARPSGWGSRGSHRAYYEWLRPGRTRCPRFEVDGCQRR